MKVGNTIIHKYKIESDFEALATELDYNISIDKLANLGDNPRKPSIQSTLYIKNGLISTIAEVANKLILQQFYKNDIKYIFDNWVFKATPTSPQGGWHDHNKMEFTNTKGEWAWVYYVTMPNKDRGNILFRDNGDEISYDPIPGDLLIFPSYLEHFPMLNPNSTTPRRIIGGNLCEVKYKTTVSLM